jgi:hypothetical protein
MDPANGLCEGCLRTLDEIAAWSRMAMRQARRVGKIEQARGGTERGMKHITFYLDFISPYAYLAFEHLPVALQGLSYSMDYKPVLFAGCSSTMASWARPRSPASASGPTARCCG